MEFKIFFFSKAILFIASIQKMKISINPQISPLERSEKDLVLPKRNSGSEIREAKFGSETANMTRYGEQYSDNRGAYQVSIRFATGFL